MKCLVFGANGFIGRHVMAAGGLFAARLGVSLVAAPTELDVGDAAAIGALLSKEAPSHVIHLAAMTFVPDSVADPMRAYEVNFLGTLNLLSALVEARVDGRLLYVSSAEVYGLVAETSLPITETQPFAPRTPYAVSKASAELACLQHALLGKVDAVIARPFNVVGPGQSSKFAVSSFARQIAELDAQGGGEIAVGNTDVSRDFVAVEDVVAAFVALLAAGVTGEAYNLCSGVETPVQHVLDRLISHARHPVSVRFDPLRARPAEQRRVVGSHAKLSAATGWKPAADLAETLRDVIDYWRRDSRVDKVR